MTEKPHIFRQFAWEGKAHANILINTLPNQVILFRSLGTWKLPN